MHNEQNKTNSNEKNVSFFLLVTLLLLISISQVHADSHEGETPQSILEGYAKRSNLENTNIEDVSGYTVLYNQDNEPIAAIDNNDLDSGITLSQAWHNEARGSSGRFRVTGTDEVADIFTIDGNKNIQRTLITNSDDSSYTITLPDNTVQTIPPKTAREIDFNDITVEGNIITYGIKGSDGRRTYEADGFIDQVYDRNNNPKETRVSTYIGGESSKGWVTTSEDVLGHEETSYTFFDQDGRKQVREVSDEIANWAVGDESKQSQVIAALIANFDKPGVENERVEDKDGNYIETGSDGFHNIFNADKKIQKGFDSQGNRREYDDEKETDYAEYDSNGNLRKIARDGAVAEIENYDDTGNPKYSVSINGIDYQAIFKDGLYNEFTIPKGNKLVGSNEELIKGHFDKDGNIVITDGTIDYSAKQALQNSLQPIIDKQSEVSKITKPWDVPDEDKFRSFETSIANVAKSSQVFEKAFNPLIKRLFNYDVAGSYRNATKDTWLGFLYKSGSLSDVAIVEPLCENFANLPLNDINDGAVQLGTVSGAFRPGAHIEPRVTDAFTEYIPNPDNPNSPTPITKYMYHITFDIYLGEKGFEDTLSQVDFVNLELKGKKPNGQTIIKNVFSAPQTLVQGSPFGYYDDEKPIIFKSPNTYERACLVFSENPFLRIDDDKLEGGKKLCTDFKPTSLSKQTLIELGLASEEEEDQQQVDPQEVRLDPELANLEE